VYHNGTVLMKVKLAKWGNSLGVRVPRAAAEAAGLQAGTEVDVVVEGRDLRIRRSIPVKHYRLEDLLAEMDRLGPDKRPELIDWGPDVGAEIIDDDYSRGLIGPPGGGPRVGRSKTDARTRAGRRSASRRVNRP
jgi:antitoxin MazE